MVIINKVGQTLEHIYTGNDRFLEDIDDYISSYYSFRVSEDDTIELLDVVCAHLLFWSYETFNDDSQAKLIYDELFSQNDILKRFTELGDPTPELIIYEFDGTSLYYDVVSENVSYSDDFETFTAVLKNGKLIMTKEEFEELGAELSYPVDEDEEFYFDFFWSTGDVYFFMSEENQIKMKEYLNKCIVELNRIYSSLNMDTINCS
jgi:hypothetical protein